MHSAPRATINLQAIQHNLKLAKEQAPGIRVMAVIKADAYGHGLVEVAGALQQADGLAIARLEEALQLRKAGIKQRLLLLGTQFADQDLITCSEQGIDIELHHLAMIDQLCRLQLTQAINAWLKIDTGMHRLGISPDDLPLALQQLQASENIDQLVLMTHFSAADETDPSSSREQITVFNNATGNCELATSLANSAALLQLPDSHGDWIRPGIMLYGANPLQKSCPVPLEAAMTLTAPVIAIRDIAAGESVGYNSCWQAQRPSRIATLAIGYGDGYPRHATNGTPVLIRGQKALLAGRVSMDLISVDITDCEGIEIGDEATLWGKDLPVEDIARQANTISYALFTGVTQRVNKRYLP